MMAATGPVEACLLLHGSTGKTRYMLPPIENLLLFTGSAALLTITPGLDTALVLRTAASEGARRAFLAGAGIALGCFAWGLLVAAGLGALLATSRIAYDILRYIGAAYLLYLGVGLLRSPGTALLPTVGNQGTAPRFVSFRRGFLTNILNPKVGIFYVSFLPQFIPSHADVAVVTVLLTTIHAVLGLFWFGALVLATQPIARALRSGVVRAWLDRLTGGLFIAFGVRLAAGGGLR